MEIALYGAGKCGKYVLKNIQENKIKKIECSMFIDNNLSINKNEYAIPIVSLKEFINFYKNKVDGVLIATSNWIFAQEMTISLLRHNFFKIYLLPEILFDGKLSILNEDGEFESYVKLYSCYKPILPYVEFHVSDFCNLKCKGCGHFSNRVTEKKFPEINEFRGALQGIQNRFRNINQIRLMGGEPFINPELGKFVYETKKFFPYADIRVVTNGLLLSKIDDELARIIKECAVTIDISQYPPTRKIIKDIIDFAERQQIKICIGEEIKQFMKHKCQEINPDIERAYKNCISKSCHFLRGKRLYLCGAPVFLYENRDFLKKNISEEMVENNSFDLMLGKENGWEILEKITKPFEICKFCSTDVEWFDWSISDDKIRKEDWIVEKE